ncbi:MAG: 8-amino-7-oxononanoate synthase [Actinomycetota bacterium]|nr:8-amino-7-oxononanoate synthase [Actinomycetota bacterium]
MTDIHDRLAELKELGLYRRLRMVSGPQGPRVVLDGKPVLLLCSNNYLGLADHPRVREAAAEAALRWGVGAGASRLVSGNMTIHRRLEERMAEFEGREACVLFGSGYLANTGVVAALAREGEVVFSDALNHASLIDGCRLARAETFVYDHLDTEHLAWGLEQARGRGALIVTDGVFSMDGDVAPLVEIVELAREYDARIVVDEAHGTGAIGPGGRGVAAEAGLEEEIDVIVGTLGKALGSYGAYAACDSVMARYLVNTARPLIFSTALPPPAVAGALAALDLLEEQPRRVRKLQVNADIVRGELEAAGYDVGGSSTQIVPMVIGDAETAMRVCEAALERGVFAQAIRPPTVPEGSSRLRLAVMASHTKSELRAAVGELTRAAAAGGAHPREQRKVPVPETAPIASSRVFDAEAREATVARAA